MAGQKPRHTVHERNHLRLWLSPMCYAGKPVWVGQISRDIGVRFTLKAWPPVTHKIDPDIDDAMFPIIEDLQSFNWESPISDRIKRLTTDPQRDFDEK
jgi:hypothetical protein